MLRSPDSTMLALDKAEVVSLKNPPPDVADGIVSQALLAAPGLRVTLFRFAAGQELSEHTSPTRVLLHVLSGVGDFTLGQEKRRLAAGDLLHLPPNLPHAVRAVEELTFLLTQAKPPGEPKRGPAK
ncbi:MAG: cupin domain-containing protein [Verrucomicrobia bacterium]|nr:cupin domain-containing protein [Verrucomicrobiota bacterium]